ncbi:hypothetical protein L6452_41080 [Arctium lappa]|uniref:Uncharacterized protein n=1 Tax=Arctium lappa TaxID=4217 RepID=A0ACB8XND2_ARCLA|nr:hypothetical protein L6452_41080 [Arctium lappa]
MRHTGLGVSSMVSPMGFLHWCLNGFNGEAVASKSRVQVKPRSLEMSGWVVLVDGELFAEMYTDDDVEPPIGSVSQLKMTKNTDLSSHRCPLQLSFKKIEISLRNKGEIGARKSTSTTSVYRRYKVIGRRLSLSNQYRQ